MRVDDNDPRYEIKDYQAQTMLKAIGLKIATALQQLPGFGFALLLFSFGEGGSMFYISDANRKDIVKVMKEFIEKEEAKENERSARES